MADMSKEYTLDESCKMGSLPNPAPLAVPYVPFQNDNPPMYSVDDGLNRGTIFPGLDLPWENTVNTTNPEEGTHLGELSALDFAVFDMQLYMNTHTNDSDVFEMLKYKLKEAEEYRRKYIKAHGPLSLGDIGQFQNEYTWLKGPWPWEYREGM